MICSKDMIFIKDATHAMKLGLNTGRTSTDRASPIVMFSDCLFKHITFIMADDPIGLKLSKIKSDDNKFFSQFLSNGGQRISLTWFGDLI